MSYRIKTVSELTGIPKNTLVAWERRYGLLSPDRAPNGYRVYSEDDVAKLVQIKSAIDDGLKISEAIERVERRHQAESSPFFEPSSFPAMRRELLVALLDFDRARADSVVRRLVGTPFPVLIDDIYFPLLRQIGDGWEKGAVTVAQEHHASSFLRDQMVAMLLSVGSGPEHGTRVACVTFPNEHHEIPVIGLTIRLALAGCNVTYLGANLPAEALASFANRNHPEWLCVSVIEHRAPEVLRSYARELREGVRSGQIAIGGHGVPRTLHSDDDDIHYLRDWHELSLLRRAGAA